MELRHLRYFVRVAEELHFGRAASLLGISQPPLSQQIRSLEQELGVDLFDRTSRRVGLTEAGRLFLAEARRTLDQAAHAMDVARRIQLGETGELSIGFITSVPLIPFVAHALFDYRADHPAVHLSLAELDRPAQLARIADGQLDMGLVRGYEPPTLPRGLIAHSLLEEPLIVALRDDHPLANASEPLWLSDVAREPMVLYGRELGAGFNEHLSLMLRRAGHQLRVAQEVSGIASLLGLVAAGFGITILSRSMSILRTDRVVYQPLADPDARSRLWLVQRDAPSLIARNFAEMLLARSREP